MKGRTLHLTLKKKWFDMIISGQKTEEYREIKPYWTRRIWDTEFDCVQFRNGYRADSPTMIVDPISVTQGVGNAEWGAPPHRVYIITLGDILETAV